MCPVDLEDYRNTMSYFLRTKNRPAAYDLWAELVHREDLSRILPDSHIIDTMVTAQGTNPDRVRSTVEFALRHDIRLLPSTLNRIIIIFSKEHYYDMAKGLADELLRRDSNGGGLSLDAVTHLLMCYVETHGAPIPEDTGAKQKGVGLNVYDEDLSDGDELGSLDDAEWYSPVSGSNIEEEYDILEHTESVGKEKEKEKAAEREAASTPQDIVEGGLEFIETYTKHFNNNETIKVDPVHYLKGILLQTLNGVNKNACVRLCLKCVEDKLDFGVLSAFQVRNLVGLLRAHEEHEACVYVMKTYFASHSFDRQTFKSGQLSIDRITDLKQQTEWVQLLVEAGQINPLPWNASNTNVSHSDSEDRVDRYEVTDKLYSGVFVLRVMFSGYYDRYHEGLELPESLQIQLPTRMKRAAKMVQFFHSLSPSLPFKVDSSSENPCVYVSKAHLVSWFDEIPPTTGMSSALPNDAQLE